MRIFSNIITFLIFICFIVVFLSCKKNTENKIEGTWVTVSVTNPNVYEYQEWAFFSNNEKLYIVQKKIGSTALVPLSSSTYKIKAGLFSKTLTLSESLEVGYNGDWKINKLKKDQLILSIYSPGQVYLEFTKK